jgi:Arc/MetJ-type ribon-helix-helix transcriptional regulator
MVQQIDELNAKVKQLTDQNVELSNTKKSIEKDSIVAESVKDLTDTKAEKLKSLVEGIEFSSTEDFVKKVNMVKEQYFKNASDEVNSGINDDEKNPQALNEEDAEVIASPSMKQYMSTISKFAKN